MAFVAVRLIDLAIFGTLGTLWIGGLLFIVTLYRWIARYEREQGLDRPQSPPMPVVEPTPIRLTPAVSSSVAARRALASSRS